MASMPLLPPFLHCSEPIKFNRHMFCSYVARVTSQFEALHTIAWHKSCLQYPNVRDAKATSFAYHIRQGGVAGRRIVRQLSPHENSLGQVISKQLEKFHAVQVICIVSEWYDEVDKAALTLEMRISLARRSMQVLLDDFVAVVHSMDAIAKHIRNRAIAQEPEPVAIDVSYQEASARVAKRSSLDDSPRRAAAGGGGDDRAGDTWSTPFERHSVALIQSISLDALQRLAAKRKVSNSVLQVFIALSILIDELSIHWDVLKEMLLRPGLPQRLARLDPSRLTGQQMRVLARIMADHQMRFLHINRQSGCAGKFLKWIRNMMNYWTRWTQQQQQQQQQQQPPPLQHPDVVLAQGDPSGDERPAAALLAADIRS